MDRVRFNNWRRNSWSRTIINGKELLCILKKYETHPDFLGDTIKDINQVGGMDDTVLHIAARNNFKQ